MNAHAAALRFAFEGGGTVLSSRAGERVVLPLAPHAIAAACFDRFPPQPDRIARAIDLIEDALDRQPPLHRRSIETSDALIAALFPPTRDTTIGRDAVEAAFQAFASVALGHPAQHSMLPADRETAAALVILRECMHHLDLAEVRIV